MTREEALNLLKIDERYPAAQRVKQAFRARCKEIHPDAGAAPGADISEVRTACDFLLKNKDFACALCNGSGRVRARMGTQTCSACNGTGEKP